MTDKLKKLARERMAKTGESYQAALQAIRAQPRFDADLSPDNPQNVAAAKANGLTYDRAAQVYRDADGCPMRDRFGQRL